MIEQEPFFVACVNSYVIPASVFVVIGRPVYLLETGTRSRTESLARSIPLLTRMNPTKGNIETTTSILQASAVILWVCLRRQGSSICSVVRLQVRTTSLCRKGTEVIHEWAIANECVTCMHACATGVRWACRITLLMSEVTSTNGGCCDLSDVLTYMCGYYSWLKWP